MPVPVREGIYEISSRPSSSNASLTPRPRRAEALAVEGADLPALLLRTDPDAPYAFLGPVTLVSSDADRPIGITWRLSHAMTGALFERFATLAQG